MARATKITITAAIMTVTIIGASIVTGNFGNIAAISEDTIAASGIMTTAIETTFADVNAPGGIDRMPPHILPASCPKPKSSPSS
jgi:hypothetical protein